MAEIKGNVQRIRFANAETFFTVASVRSDEEKGLVTLVGVLPGLAEGMKVLCRGEWHDDRRYGRQFRAESYTEVVPVTPEGVAAYLSSGIVPGIGPKLALRIVEALGEKALEIISETPHRLGEVEGLGTKRVGQITKALNERKAAQEALLFLYGIGLTPNMAARIYRRYADDTVRLIKSNPYRLTNDVRGIGFVRADQVAKGMGISEDDPMRVEAGVHHSLAEATTFGHCFLPRSILVEVSAQLLGVHEGLIEKAIKNLEAAGRVVLDPRWDAENPAIYPETLFRAEGDVAAQLSSLVMDRPSTDAVKKRIHEVAATLGVSPSDDQVRALELVFSQGAAILTGGPGTGKTTIIRLLLGAIDVPEHKVLLAAPTGRAAKRLNEATGREAKTLHRTLEYMPMDHSFRRNQDFPLEAELVIIDEASMLDLPLMWALTSALKPPTRLLLVGDVDQLPPVGPGSPFVDAIQSGCLPVARLSRIFRQGAGSAIVDGAHRINEGETPEPTPPGTPLQDFYFIARETPEDIKLTLEKLISDRIPNRFGLDPIRDVQVLSPMRGGLVGIESLNLSLQALLNPVGESMDVGQTTYRVDDKVMQIRNDYDRNVFNGDVGTVYRVLPKERRMIVLVDGRAVTYEREHMDDLVLAYATSVHKAQGSEYPAVVLVLSTQHFTMLKRNLVYTGITRGRKLVVLVGSQRALQIAASRSGADKRNTGLIERLKAVADD